MASDLITRLREAKEGSRELDARVWCETNDCDFIVDVVAGKVVAKSRTGKPLWHLGRPLMWLGWVDPGEHSLNFTPLSDMGMPDGPIPAYTTDLSAAVALCERVLPGWHWSIRKKSTNPDFFEGLVTQAAWSYAADRFKASHDSAPIALCLAILTAKEKANDRDQ